MAIKLPAALYSPDQVQQCAEELRAVAAGRRRQTTEATSTEPVVSAETEALLASYVDQVATLSGLEELATDLEATLTTAARLHLTLAAPPSRRLREELAEWLRLNLRPDLLITFSVNPDIGGGMVVRTTNHIYDLSFRSLLLAEPAGFTKVLERV